MSRSQPLPPPRSIFRFFLSSFNPQPTLVFRLPFLPLRVLGTYRRSEAGPCLDFPLLLRGPPCSPCLRVKTPLFCVWISRMGSEREASSALPTCGAPDNLGCRHGTPSPYLPCSQVLHLLPSTFYLLPSTFYLLPSAFCLLPSLTPSTPPGSPPPPVRRRVPSRWHHACR